MYVGFNAGDVVDALMGENDPGIANTKEAWIKRGLGLLFRREY